MSDSTAEQSELHEDIVRKLNARTGSAQIDCTHGSLGRAFKEEADTLTGAARSVFEFLQLATYLDFSEDAKAPLQPVELLLGFDRQIVASLGAFAYRIEHVDLRARVLDIAQLLAPSKEKVALVSQTLEAYSDSSKQCWDLECWPPFFDRVQRQAQISLERRLRRTETLDYILTLLRENASDGTSFLPLKLAELAMQFPPIDHVEVAALLDSVASRAWDSGLWYISRSYYALKADFLKGDEHLEARRGAQVKAAQTWEMEAESRAGQSSLVAIHFLQSAIESYRKIGGYKEIIQKLHFRLLELQKHALKEMTTISGEVDLSDAVQTFSSKISGHDNLTQALISFVCLVLTQLPKKSGLQAWVEEGGGRSPIRDLMPAIVMDPHNGRTLRREHIESDEQKKINALYKQQGIHWGVLVHALIEPGRRIMTAEHRVTSADIELLLAASPFIAPDHEKLYCRGIYEGFKGEYDVASHLLVPQLEASLRHILQAQGTITSRLDNKLIQDEYLLGKLLEYPELEGLLGEDVIFALKGLLNERAGSNFRNLLSHGLLTDADVWSSPSVCIWALSLALAVRPLLTIGPEVDPEGGAAPARNEPAAAD